MNNRFVKYTIIPIIYILLGTILFGKQDLMIVIFLAIVSVVFNFLIDAKKNPFVNFLEINGVFIVLFLVGLMLKSSDKILIVQYLLLVALSYSVVFILKKNSLVQQN